MACAGAWGGGSCVGMPRVGARYGPEDGGGADFAAGGRPGPQGYKAMFGALRAAFPDLDVQVEHVGLQ